MKSNTLPSFWDAYAALDERIKERARKAFRLWVDNPFHPSLHFKCINVPENIWSVTPNAISAIQIGMLRNASPARKLVLVEHLNLTVKTLAMAGLKTRYLNDSPELLRRRLADLVLGPELAPKVYGPYPVE